MSQKINNTIRMVVGDGAIVPKMVKAQPANIEKHGATIPKMQPTPAQNSGGSSNASGDGKK
ncbi:hypothetical protein HLB25_19540 [Dickeya dadantii]|uniref:hypothetical protein n=1 Tax=Dickeya dadantii TaxID=204038 RepID=UPI00149561C2|nr:hypothetical protein [Dickeya dadantii]NPE56465.1 hypothetical protein [Dickeya dadantii]NPE68750.1 hypothetical protein [Dickeya dadantii]